jgi:hypothetical protein
MTLGPAIILIIIAAIAGYVIGIVDSRLTASLRKKTDEVSAPETELVAKETNRPGEHTVLKVTVDEGLKWHLELDGTRLDNPDAISPEQHQRTVNVVVQMRPWLEGKAVPVAAAPVPEPLPQRLPITSPVVQPPPASAPLKIDAFRGFRSLLNNDVKAPGEKKSISIVTMIDDVLQAKLLGSPLMEKAIRLEEGPLGEVVVCVGSQRYEGVGAVPEGEIRDIIKAAIADWEKSR